MRGAHIQNLGVRPLELPGNEFVGKAFTHIEDVLDGKQSSIKINRVIEVVFDYSFSSVHDRREGFAVEVEDELGEKHKELLGRLNPFYVLCDDSLEHSARIDVMLNHGR